jgi:dolichol-phosphate mannosyltransferase
MELSKMYLSVIIPSYQEEENLKVILPQLNISLKQVLSELNKLHSKNSLQYEIIVVDTFTAMDRTKQICLENSVTYCKRNPNNEYGSAIKTGIGQAKGEKILFMDADGSHSPHFIGEMLKESLKGTSDIIMASRYVEGGKTNNPLPLIVMSRIVNWGYSLILGLPYKDISNSLKLYNAQDLKNLCDETDTKLKLKLKSKNFDIIEEIIFKIFKNYQKEGKKLRVKEIPFTFEKRLFGETKRNLFVFIFSYFVTLLKLRKSYE